MKYILILLFFATCQKAPQAVPATTTTQPTPNSHSIELKWITSSNSYKRTYTYPSAQGQNYLNGKTDTAIQYSHVVYTYPQGLTTPYVHIAEGKAYAQTTDSIEVQIWVDGVLKAKKKDEYYVYLSYQY